MKVSDYLKDSHSPQGDLGASVEPIVAARVADEIRMMLVRACMQAAEYDGECDHDELAAAWNYLNARERRTWKEMVGCGYAHKRI